MRVGRCRQARFRRRCRLRRSLPLLTERLANGLRPAADRAPKVGGPPGLRILSGAAVIVFWLCAPVVIQIPLANLWTRRTAAGHLGRGSGGVYPGLRSSPLLPAS